MSRMRTLASDRFFFFEVSNVHNLEYLGVSKSVLKVFHVHLFEHRVPYLAISGHIQYHSTLCVTSNTFSSMYSAT